MSDNNEETLEETLGRKREIWHFHSKWWRSVHWTVGVIGVTSSTIAATSEQPIGRFEAQFFALVAAICFGVIGFTNPQRRAARFLRAYQLLDAALLEYKYNRFPDKKVTELLESHKRAEALFLDIDQLEATSAPPQIEAEDALAEAMSEKNDPSPPIRQPKGLRGQDDEQ